MDGYAKVATFMGNHNEMTIFRGFQTLGFQNLLYLQAELVELEGDINGLALADKNSSHPTRPLYEKHWHLLSRSEDAGHGEQWHKVLQFRAKLKEFYETMAHQKMVCNFQKPAKSNLEFLRDWLTRKKMGGCPILGKDSHAWDMETEPDLVTLIDSRDTDSFTNWVCRTIVPGFHAVLGRHIKKPVAWDPESGVCDYSESKILTILDICATVASSLLSISSIVVLYFVSNMSIRLGVVAAFTAVFSLVLALMTKARRVEIFVATTTFAAVQVVFIGTNGSGGNNC